MPTYKPINDEYDEIDEYETIKLDLNDPYVIMHLVGDINDALLEQGRDDDAADFVLQAKGLKHTDKDWTLDDLLAIACQYVDIEDVSDARYEPPVNRPIIEDKDDDEDWSDDYEVVNHALQSEPSSALHAPMSTGPVDLTIPEFPDVEMYWDLDVDVGVNMKNAVLALCEYGDDRVLRNFVQDWQGLRRSTWTELAMFQLVWSYMTVYPIPEQYGDVDW